MKRTLTKRASNAYYYKDGDRIEGFPDSVGGDPSFISGDLTFIRGNLSRISGNLTGIRGNLTRISGNLDDCELTDEDRKRGVDISELLIND